MPLRYRLALDLGPTSLGWAMFRLNDKNDPTAVILTGVRIFSDGRNPKDGASLAVSRRQARSMRRRRDRLLKRKSKLMAALVKHGFSLNTLSSKKPWRSWIHTGCAPKVLIAPWSPMSSAGRCFT